MTNFQLSYSPRLSLHYPSLTNPCMRPFRSVATVLLLSLFFSACTMYGPGTPAVMLSTQPLLVEIGSDLATDTIPEGSVIYYLGEKSLDSTFMKVRYEGAFGWVPTSVVALKAKPGFLTAETDVYRWQSSGDVAGELAATALVAVDTTILSRSHVVYLSPAGMQQQGWVPADMIGYDLSVRPSESMAYSGDVGEAEMVAINIYFGDAPQSIIDHLSDQLSIASEVMKGQIIVPSYTAESELENIVSTLVPGPGENGWKADARAYYFWAYISPLPAFVDIGPRTDYTQYVDDKYKNELQAIRSFLMKSIDRSPQQISRLYNTYGGILKQLLTTYDVSEDIQGLITAYEHIRSLPDYRAKCANVTSQVGSWDRENADAKGMLSGGYILADQRPLYAPILGKDAAEEETYSTSIIWRYSFWVRRIDEGNDAAVYEILQDLSGIRPSNGEQAVKTTTCVFQDYSLGDCGHMEFDCGDYGEADTEQLSAVDQALWNDLTISDSEGEHGNPKYIGKSFTIKEGIGIGRICNEGQGGNGEVPVLLEFKLD